MTENSAYIDKKNAKNLHVLRARINYVFFCYTLGKIADIFNDFNWHHSID